LRKLIAISNVSGALWGCEMTLGKIRAIKSLQQGTLSGTVLAKENGYISKVS